MWRLKILIFILALPALAVRGYTQDRKSFAGIQGGFSIPFGKYREATLDQGSFALSGFSVSVEGAWFFHPNIGAGASAGLAMHPVDVSLLGWEKVKADPFLQDVVIRSDPYLIFSAMGGIYGRYKLFSKLNLTGKFLAGLLYGRTPYQLHKPEYFLTGPSYYEITPAKDRKYSWQAGLGLEYKITPCYDLFLSGEILYDELVFRFNTSTGIREDPRVIALVNIQLGFRFRVGKIPMTNQPDKIETYNDQESESGNKSHASLSIGPV
ncbi:MAG: hypothetical protein JXA03_12010 [Bacteroidales bacterium]|nr:hypothetical protein [Bacteroidales bacterium]